MLAALADSYLLWWIAQVIAVAILVLLFLRWRPNFLKRRTLGETLGAALDARAARIQEQLEAAERSRREAARIREQAQADIVEAREEEREILARAEKTCKAIQDEMAVRAREEYERIVAQARNEIDYERRQAELALQKNASAIVINAAAEVVRNALSPESDRRIIGESLSELKDVRDLP
jgi:F-type H+-transporting ATPase subunit b